MKSLLKKLHIRSNQSQSQSQSLNQSSESSEVSINKQPLSSITGWLNSVTSKRNQSPKSIEEFDSITSSQLDAAISELRGFDDDNNRDAEAEEEHQIQLALELSAREDPEAVQIEAVKQISLGSCVAENTPAEIVSCRYWVS